MIPSDLRRPVALTRAVPPAIVRCELTHLERIPVDPLRASAQHRDYERALEALGCRVEHMPDAPELPDSVFVEDAALVLDEVAIITRPGAESRRAETPSVAGALARYRTLHALTAPALMDGGDVLRLGRRLFVGISTRTNREGARQLAAIVQPFGYAVRCVSARGCLHLKSAVTSLGDGRVLYNPAWVDAALLDGAEALAVDPDEPHAANVLHVGEALIVAAQHVRTRQVLARAGYRTHAVDVSELAKAEAGVTCCSLIVS